MGFFTDNEDNLATGDEVTLSRGSIYRLNGSLYIAWYSCKYDEPPPKAIWYLGNHDGKVLAVGKKNRLYSATFNPDEVHHPTDWTVQDLEFVASSAWLALSCAVERTL